MEADQGSSQEEKTYENKGRLWATDSDAELPLRIESSGEGATEPLTLYDVFKKRVDKTPNRPALKFKKNKDAPWETLTWAGYFDQIKAAAKSFIHLGLQPAEAVCIIGFNSPEWLVADVGAIFAGGIAAGIYTTNQPEACHYIANHCDAVVVVVENEGHLAKFLKIRDRLPKLKALVQWSGKIPEDVEGVYSWADFLELGKDVEDNQLNERLEGLKPGKCCTLIYTSGTTGPPKAVMMSHDNMTWTATIASTLLSLTENDHGVSYLPLSHIAAQMLDVITPIITGSITWFAQPDALRGSLGFTLKEVRPTWFLGVPRVWEKMMEKMKEIGASNTGIKKTLGDWAKNKGLEGGYADQRHQPKPWGWWFAENLVFNKVHAALGFDRCRLFYSGAAPISKEVLEYFLSLNIPICEVYGMSECTGPEAMGAPHDYKTGTVGKIIPGVELKVADKDAEGNGELCFRGRHVFMGYLHDDASTNDTVDSEGYLHSGDIGRLDEDGFLSITGRIKELIITAGGENIPPVLIETELMKELDKVVSNAMVVGDQKKFLSCLFTLKCKLNPEAQEGEYQFLDELVDDAVQVLKAQGSTAVTVQDAAKCEVVRAFLQKGIDAANERATSRAQGVRKFAILPKDFTLEGGELTPTLKLKRRIVLRQCEAVIEELYAEDGTGRD